MIEHITTKDGKTKNHTFIFASLLFIYFIEAACIVFRFPDKWLLVIIAPPVCFVELSLVFGFCFLITPALRRMGFGARFILHIVLLHIYIVVFAYSSFQLPMICREATGVGIVCFVLLYLAYMVPIGFDLGLFFVSTRVALVKGFEIANTIKDLTYKQVFFLEGFVLKQEYTVLIEEHHITRRGGKYITRYSAFPIVPESWNKEEPIYIFGAYDKGDEQDIQPERHGKTAEECFNDKFAKSKTLCACQYLMKAISGGL